MATAYERYVDPDSDGDGDGTTSALTGANCAFSSLFDAEAAGDAAGQPPLNLTTASDTYKIWCQSTDAAHTADSAKVIVDGWTVADGYSITVEAVEASRASTSYSASKYRLEVGEICIAVQDSYLAFRGLQIRQTAQSGANQRTVAMSGATSTNSTWDSCFIWRDVSMLTNPASAFWAPNSATFKMFNTIVISRNDNTTDLITTNNVMYVQASASIYSCTVVGARYGIYRVNGTVVAKNTYVGDCYTQCWFGTITKTNCASSDTSSDGTDPHDSVAYSTDTFTSVTLGSENFALTSGGGLTDHGTDTSGDAAPLNFTDDINGTARGATWDIGAHEYAAGAGPTGSPWYYYAQQM